VPRLDEVVLHLANVGTEQLDVAVADAYMSGDVVISLRPGRSTTRNWSLARTHGWYDLLVTVAGDADFAWRYAGHVENGEESITDPLMGGLI
jgi:phospholipase C